MCVARFLATRKNIRPLKPRQNESDIVCFARKRYTVTVNGILVSPSWFCCASNTYFRQCTVNWRKIHGIPLFGSCERRHRIFCQKDRDSIGIPPSWFCCALISQFSFNVPLNWRKIHRCNGCLEFLN